MAGTASRPDRRGDHVTARHVVAAIYLLASSPVLVGLFADFFGLHWQWAKTLWFARAWLLAAVAGFIGAHMDGMWWLMVFNVLWGGMASVRIARLSGQNRSAP